MALWSAVFMSVFMSVVGSLKNGSSSFNANGGSGAPVEILVFGLAMGSLGLGNAMALAFFCADSVKLGWDFLLLVELETPGLIFFSELKKSSIIASPPSKSFPPANS